MPQADPNSRALHLLLARPRGFCAGVVRAIAIVERALERHDGPVYVRHEIVHNAAVVARLRDKGAVFVDDLDEVPDGAVTVFSAHGVPRSVEIEAARRALPVLDATCPLVAKVHLHGSRYAREGRHIVLIGHAGHAEVVGTIGQIDAPVHLVASLGDVAGLPLAPDAPIAYLTQTTLGVDETRGLIEALHARFADVIGPDVADICYATQNRQTAVLELARRCEAVIVVGARNSSNSTRLAEIAAGAGIPAWLVADADEVDLSQLAVIDRLGLTAGASAPEDLVAGVVERLAQHRAITVTELDGAEENVSFTLPPPLREGVRRQAASGHGRLF